MCVLFFVIEYNKINKNKDVFDSLVGSLIIKFLMIWLGNIINYIL